MLIRAEMYHKADKRNDKRKRKADDKLLDSPTHPKRYYEGCARGKLCSAPYLGQAVGCTYRAEFSRGSRGLPLQVKTNNTQYFGITCYTKLTLAD